MMSLSRLRSCDSKGGCCCGTLGGLGFRALGLGLALTGFVKGLGVYKGFVGFRGFGVEVLGLRCELLSRHGSDSAHGRGWISVYVLAELWFRV